MPTWWNERRFGIFVHSNLATVPAWAPIGEYSDWYRSHLGEDVADILLHPKPMVEVLAHHRDRWGHIEQYDDFLPLIGCVKSAGSLYIEEACFEFRNQ